MVRKLHSRWPAYLGPGVLVLVESFWQFRGKVFGLVAIHFNVGGEVSEVLEPGKRPT